MNNVTNLSEHFTLAELTKTNTRIENVPNEAQVKNLKRLCGWLEMLRSEWNKRYGDGDDPIIINSGCAGYGTVAALCRDPAGHQR